MTKIKLCGLTRECDIKVANILLPDYIGFVFEKGSLRYLSPEKAKKLKEALNPAVKAVGVFVNEDKDSILRLAENKVIDIIQLHGSESEEYIKALKNKTDAPIIKAFRIDNENDVIKANLSSADFVMFDSGKGGTGKAFNWDLIKGVTRPFFLAGGLGVNNVKGAVLTLNPYAVDVSSGIETDGLKDKTKMTEFVNALRNI